MEDVFDRKVHEKEKKLAATEEDLKKKLYESQENLDKQKIDLEAKMATFEKVIFWFVFLIFIHYFLLFHLLRVLISNGSSFGKCREGEMGFLQFLLTTQFLAYLMIFQCLAKK